LENKTITHRIKRSIISALPKGMQTAWWLIKITIPVSFGVMLLDYFGILSLIALYTGSLFRHFGLPGASAVVLVTSIFASIYSVVAVLSILELPMREGIILATMCLVSHNFIVETTVTTRAGSSTIRMLLLRLGGSFVVAWMLNLIMPGSISPDTHTIARHQQDFSEMLMFWFNSTTRVIIKILVLVNVLLIFQRIMDEFGWITAIEKPLSPLMKIMGLPRSTTLSWVVANLIGLAYGSAIMIDESEKGKMSREDADLLNHHISLSHSQLEDPLLFLTLGFTIHWLIWPRLIIAIAAVWLRKAEIKVMSVYMPKSKAI
jgi:hypothetical protein